MMYKDETHVSINGIRGIGSCSVGVSSRVAWVFLLLAYVVAYGLFSAWRRFKSNRQQQRDFIATSERYAREMKEFEPPPFCDMQVGERYWYNTSASNSNRTLEIVEGPSPSNVMFVWLDDPKRIRRYVKLLAHGHLTPIIPSVPAPARTSTTTTTARTRQSAV